MSKRGAWVSFNSFSGGERSDLPPHMIPDDALLKASNVVTDKVGRVSKRGPIQPYLFNQIAGTLQQVGVSKLNIAGKTPSIGFGVNADGYFLFALPEPPSRKRTGSLSGPASTTSGVVSVPLVAPEWGPSFNSFGLCSFPLQSRGNVSPVLFFGAPRITTATSSHNYANATLTVVANQETITYSGTASTVTESDIGKIVYLNDNAIGVTTREYIGVITSIVSNTQFTVYPAPTQAFTSAANGRLLVNSYWSIGGRLAESGGGTRIPSSSTFGCVHQNRVVLLTSATTTFSGSITGPTVDTQKNMISWSSISGDASTAANSGSDGLLAMLYAGWPKSQNIVLDTSNVVGLVSLDANNLLVLCADKTLLISGTLGTVIPSAPINESSFNVRTVSPEIGCVDAASIQRTPLGVMFAGRDGIYITDGATFKNVTEDKIQNKWNVYNQTNSYSFNRVTGSAVIRDTHYVIFTEQGPNLICDLYNDFSWSELEFETSAYGTFDSTRYLKTYPETFGPTVFSYGGNNIVVDSTSTGSSVVAGLNVLSNTGTEGDPTYVSNVLSRPSGWSPGGFNTDVAISDDGNTIVFCENSFSPGTGLAVYKKVGTSWSISSDINTVPSTSGRIAFAKGNASRVAVACVSTVEVYTCSTLLTLEATITPPFAPSTVAMSNDGSVLVVASETANTNRGRIYVYTRSGTTWSLSATLDPAGAIANDRVGQYALALSSDGTRIAVAGGVNTGSQTSIYTWVFSSGTWSPSTTLQPFNGTFRIRYKGLDISSSGSEIFGVEENSRKVFRYRFNSTISNYVLFENFPIPQAVSSPGALSLSGNGKMFYVSDFAAQYRSLNGAPGAYNTSAGFHVFNAFAATSAKPIFGVGVHDWSGSTEVYAPRLNNSGSTLTSDAIVLLDSILDVDNPIQTNASGFNQLVDASTTTAYNSQIVTKSFALSDPTILKAYKSFLMTYAADARLGGDNPIEFRFAESLQPVLDFSSPAYATRGDTSSNTKSKPARISIVPRPIDNGISFGLNTVYESGDSATGQGQFKLYEIGLNAAALRAGRIIQ